VGETETDPLLTGVTAPIPLIEALVAPLLVQLNVDAPPVPIDVGLAEKVPLGGGTTVTATCCKVVPPIPVNVSR
jgi:hypothetical protein